MTLAFQEKMNDDIADSNHPLDSSASKDLKVQKISVTPHRRAASSDKQNPKAQLNHLLNFGKSLANHHQKNSLSHQRIQVTPKVGGTSILHQIFPQNPRKTKRDSEIFGTSNLSIAVSHATDVTWTQTTTNRLRNPSSSNFVLKPVSGLNSPAKKKIIFSSRNLILTKRGHLDRNFYHDYQTYQLYKYKSLILSSYLLSFC